MNQRRNSASPPANLSAEAKELWRRTLTEFSFDTASDFTLLRQLCETVDRLRDCQKEIKRDGMLVEGAAGQRRPHPLLVVEESCRRSILACVRALKLTSSPEI